MTRPASTVQVFYDGTDITAHVMPAGARFEMLMNATPGSFEMTIKDRERALDFVTGKELVCKVDGREIFGGYITSVTRKFAFPVVRTDNLANVTQRLWVLRGVDYNTLLDKRVLRNPADYLHSLPNFDSDEYDGALLREALTDSKYFDVPAGFDVTSEIDDVSSPFLRGSTAAKGAWLQQGTRMRETFEDFARLSGAVFYIGADKVFRYKALEDVEARWGFSDVPNKAAITAASGYQDATIGFREIDATMDGASTANDALIWGGSEFSGSGQTVFAREQNAASIAEHQRWQVGEVHFGEDGFKLQSGVDARADVIVNGGRITEISGGAFNPGLALPQWSVRLTWFAHDVPRIAGVADHLKAGDLVHIILNTFEEAAAPIELVLPLRSLTTTFVGTKPPPDLPYVPYADEIAYVKFEGSFGLQLGDPHTLWGFLLQQPGNRRTVVATVDGSNPSPYGALFSGEPTPATDGVETVFNLPDSRGYIAGTTDVYLTGSILRRGTDYTESDPDAGEITLTTSPDSADWLWVVCRTT